MKENVFSEILYVIFYFMKMIFIICSVFLLIALGVTYWFYYTKDHSFVETFTTAVGLLGIALLMAGALSVAKGPGSRGARVEASRTQVQDMGAMRGELNPLLAKGLSIFFSGVILGALALYLT